MGSEMCIRDRGTGLATEHALKGRIGRRTPAWLRWFVVFNLIALGWILFRSADVGQFIDYISGFTDWSGATLWSWTAVGIIVLVIGMQLLPERPVERLQTWIEDRNPMGLAVGLAAVILLVAATVPSQGVPPFIYFQF